MIHKSFFISVSFLASDLPLLFGVVAVAHDGYGRSGFPFSHPLLTLLDRFDDFRRIARHDGHGRNIFRHHAAGAHDGSVTDPDTRQYRRVDSDPHLVLDDDRASVGGAAVVGIGVVVDRYQIHFGADKYVVTDGDAAASEEGTALLDKTTQKKASVSFYFAAENR